MPSSTGNPSLESIVVGVVKSNRVDCGVTVLDGLDCGLEPIPFVARTRNVYALPLTRPVRVALVADALTCTGVCATLPMNGVTVWLVIGLSPSPAAAVHVTCAELVAGSAWTPVGATGGTGLAGVTVLDAADAGPAPLALSASTRNV